MKKLSFNLHNFLYYTILILPLILVKQISVLGDNVLPLVVIALEVILICKKILDHKGKRFIIRKYPMDKYICFFILVFVLGKILGFLFGFFFGELPDMEFYTTILAITMLYLLMDFRADRNRWWQSVAVVCATIGSVAILLTCINGIELDFLTDALTATSDGVISYLVLANVLCIMNYILMDDSLKWSNVWLVPVALQMFALLLMQSHIANWLVVFLLLAVASFFRPRASLIKKVGILLFLFLFLWSNMSLVLGYTKWFSVGAVYSLEASVYMELLLALGGLLFFHYWDKLPENMDLHRISMIKMQICFKRVLGVLALVFLIFVTGGNMWQSLAGEGLQGFIRVLALPLSSEIMSGSSTFFYWLLELGVVAVLLILIWLYQMGSSLYRRCGVDRENNNFFFLLYIVFLIEMILWELPCNVLMIYMFLISMGNVKPKLIEMELEKEDLESETNQEGENHEKI